MHFIVLDTYTPHVYVSFDIYYVFTYDTWRPIGRRRIGTYIANDDAKADSANVAATCIVKL